jgi:hypothetical protein
LAGRRNQARSSLSGQRLIANLNVADHALTVGIDIDASLNIAIRCVDRGSDVDPAAAKSKMVVVVMMMMMMVVMVIKLSQLQQRFWLSCPRQIVGEQSLFGVRNRFQQIRVGFR